LINRHTEGIQRKGVVKTLLTRFTRKALWTGKAICKESFIIDYCSTIEGKPTHLLAIMLLSERNQHSQSHVDYHIIDHLLTQSSHVDCPEISELPCLTNTRCSTPVLFSMAIYCTLSVVKFLVFVTRTLLSLHQIPVPFPSDWLRQLLIFAWKKALDRPCHKGQLWQKIYCCKFITITWKHIYLARRRF
jgi:hypothetical protein